MANVTAIILAAGRGSRMNSDIPKQFLEIKGRMVISYSIDAFEQSSVSEIILVTSQEYLEFCRKEVVEKFHYNKVSQIVEGGSERYWSVRNGLKAANGAEYVLIHDAARPCISVELIEESIRHVLSGEACTLGVPVKDTIKVVDEMGYGIDTPPRNLLWQVQTPQSFRYDDIMKAYKKMEQSKDMDLTDDTMILERYLGKKTRIIYGDYRNIKITTNDDLELVGNFLKNMKKIVDTE